MSKELLKNSLNDLDFEHVINNLVEKATFYKSKEKASKLYPSFSQNEVKTLLKQTEEGRKLLEIEGNFNLRGISNIEESIKQAKLDGILSGKDLIQISNTLDTFTNLKTKISKHNQQFEHLSTFVTKISDLNYLSFSIKNQISPNGLVKDSASPILSQLRNDVREAYERLTSALQNILKKPHVESAIQDNVISIRGDRLVLQVKSNLRSRVPGVVHDASNTGMTLFIEPFSTISLCNSWRELALEENREVIAILKNLSEQVGVLSDEIVSNIQLCSDLDLIIAKSKLSESWNGLRFENETFNNLQLKLINSRHPLLPENSIPFSIEIDDSWNVLVITGPNTGGKTVALKTIGLLSLMNQSGIQIPAEQGSYLPIFDGIYSDIGDQQSIENSVSTFSSHIKNITKILNFSTPNSLVLLDEIGSSTDPEEGSAIAMAILKNLSEKCVLTIVTTHHRALAIMAEGSNKMRNASFTLDNTTLQPTYSMSFGVIGSSYAMDVAKELGLPDSILKLANDNISTNSKNTQKWLNEISKKHEILESQKNEVSLELSEISTTRKNLTLQLDYLKNNTEEILNSAKNLAQIKYSEILENLDRAKSALSWIKKSPKDQSQVINEIETIENNVEKLSSLVDSELNKRNLIPSNIEIGAKVQSTVYKWIGYIKKINYSDQTVEVQVGKISMKVLGHQISVIKEDIEPSKTITSNITLIDSTNIHHLEIDIRGIRVAEAQQKLDIFLDQSLKEGLNEVRIIHGKGSGALRSTVKELLTNHPLVKSFDQEADSKGEIGSTIVTLI